jgi:hypothetical protein
MLLLELSNWRKLASMCFEQKAMLRRGWYAPRRDYEMSGGLRSHENKDKI